VDFALTEDQIRFKQAAREFLNKEVVPYRAEWDRRESVDTAIIGKLGLRGQVTSELAFTDVRVPPSAMLGDEGAGFKIAKHSLDTGRVSVAAGCTGISQACLEAVVEYAGSRTQFGRPLAGFQLIQDMIAEISVDTDASRRDPGVRRLRLHR